MDVADDDARSATTSDCSGHTRSTFYSARDRRNGLINTRGVILRTSIVSTGWEDSGPILNRTVLLDSTLYEQPVHPYVPPIFLLVMYERTPYMRYTGLDNERVNAFDSTTTVGSTTNGPDGPSEQIRYDTDDTEKTAAERKRRVNNTELVWRENNVLIRELLRLADCLPDKTEHCFLRMEHAGSLQSMFAETFPTPALKVGGLVRLSYKSLRKRDEALDFLKDNGAANADVYAINYSSNKCATTVTKYLEPLFRHALDLQTAWSVNRNSAHSRLDTNETEVKEEEEEDNGVFDVNFHLLDAIHDSQQMPNGSTDNPIFFAGSTERSYSQNVHTAIREKTSRTSPLTVHDTSQFYQHPKFSNDRNGAALLQSLPAVYVRVERDMICLSACTDYKGQNVLLHVYYVWTKALADTLTELSAAVNSSTNGEENHTVRTCVCDVFDNQTAAYIRMLDDAKLCFWKKDTNTYVRLVLNSEQDNKTYSRFVLYSLITKGTTNAKVGLQSKIEGSRKTVDGSLNVFPNSITLDCSKLVADLDSKVSSFAATYERITRDATVYANADGAADLPDHVLLSRQRNVGNMLLQFKLERIGELAYSTAGEMYLGVLDLYGTTDCNNRTWRYDDPVANYLFVRTLVNESVYTSATTFDTDLRALLKKKTYNNNNNNDDVDDDKKNDDKIIPTPCATFQEGVYYAQEDQEIVEIDVESAFPTIIETFNVSPETAVIMRKTDFDKIERQLEGTMMRSDVEGPFKLSRWCFVVPYVDAPEELVIVALIANVYKGCVGSAMQSLVLKRRTNRRIAAHFYKRLANRLCGCLGQKGSDLFAVHCLAATSSLCRSILTGTLGKLQHIVRVLRTQTDGGLLQATGKSETLAADINHAFANTIDALLARRDETEGATTAVVSLMKLKLRNVAMCFVAAQNKYAIRYWDDEKALKGHPAKFVPSVAAEAAVTDAVIETLDDISQAGYECKCEDVINGLMDRIAKRMLYNERLANKERNNDGAYYVERTVPLENPHEENKILDVISFKYDQHCRFGDTVPLWPVIQVEGDRLTRAYVCRPHPMRTSIVADRFAVMRHLINAWALELCRSQCYDFRTDRQAEGNYFSLFYGKLVRTGNHYARAVHNNRRCD